MSNATQQIVAKAWNFAHVLRDEGLSDMAYTEQITFLLFLKMADELTRPPHGRKPLVPGGYDWPTLLAKDGDALEVQYRHTLEHLSGQTGMLGAIFKKARPEIQNPAILRRLIVDLIDKENWSSMQADVKGDIYEGLLAKSAEESPKGAGQYFTPRELIRGIVDVMQPGPGDTFCDPAIGTGGFALAAHQYVSTATARPSTPTRKSTCVVGRIDSGPEVRFGLHVHHDNRERTPPLVRHTLDHRACVRGAPGTAVDCIARRHTYRLRNRAG